MSLTLRQQLEKASDAVHRGGVIAYPTESCFGLGCHPKNYLAVKRILRLKHRCSSKGLILIGHDVSQFRPYLAELPRARLAKMNQSWPSATTWLSPAADTVPGWLCGYGDKIALRVPGHAIARQLCKQCGHALVSTSANLSGHRAARSSAQVLSLFADQIDFVMDMPCGRARRASTIIDLLNDSIVRH